MKTIAISLFTLFLITACDAPQRVRSVNGSFGNGLTYNNGTTSGTSTAGSTNGTSSAGVTSGATSGDSGTTLPAGFTGCNTSTDFYAAGIGRTSVCQSTQNETTVRVMFTTTDNELGTCMIPTYKDGTGSSMYLGQPQCTFHTENKVIYGSIPKTRVGFTNYPINGVMIMKRTAINDYFACMDAYVNFGTIKYPVPACPYGAATSAQCAAAAQTYMTSKCSTFKSVYTSQYMDITLR